MFKSVAELGMGKQDWFAANTVGSSRGVGMIRKFCILPPHSSLETVFPHNLGKYEIKRTSGIPISQLFSELGKNWFQSFS